MDFERVLINAYMAYVQINHLLEVWILVGMFLLFGLVGLQRRLILPLAVATSIAATTFFALFPYVHPLSGFFGIYAAGPFGMLRGITGAWFAFVLVTAMLLFMTIAPWHLGVGVRSLYLGNRRLVGGVHTVAASVLTIAIVTVGFSIWIAWAPPTDSHNWWATLSLYAFALTALAPLVLGAWHATRVFWASARYAVAKPLVATAAVAVVAVGAFGTALGVSWHLDYSARQAEMKRIQAKAAKIAKALRILDKKVATDPDNFLARSTRGRLLALAGHTKRAIAELSVAVKLQPDNAQVHFDRGKLYLKIKHLDLALSDFDEVVRIAPTYATAYQMRARTRLAQHDPEGALADAEKAVSLAPGSTRFHLTRGLVYEALGNTSGAASDFRIVLRHKPGNKEIRARLRKLVANP